MQNRQESNCKCPSQAESAWLEIYCFHIVITHYSIQFNYWKKAGSSDYDMGKENADQINIFSEIYRMRKGVIDE